MKTTKTPAEKTAAKAKTTATTAKSPTLTQQVTRNKEVTFEFFAPDAKRVAVAGSFNKWSTDQLSLTKGKNGKWIASVELPLGSYEYRFFVDGAWQNDQKPVACTPNCFGSMNCVLEVKEAVL